MLEEIIAERGRPEAICCDNGPGLTSRYFLPWCIERKMALMRIQTGKAHTECTGRVFSWAVAGRMFGAELVRELV
jgi:hypothetical protein